MEGRAPGTRGDQLATEYIATQFALMGARPSGDQGTYFQKVPLVGANTEPSATLNAGDLSFQWLNDFVGVSRTQKPQDGIDGEVVFVGHGITAPEFRWDDYKDVDVKGKILLLFTNEPPSEDPKFFGGKALTYYGRWTYKYEEATRRGAQAVFILHTTPTAGYGWDVVRSSWGREDPQVKLAPGENALHFAGWLTTEAAQKLLRTTGKTVEQWLAMANSRDFRPMPLGIRMHGRFPTQIRDIETRNVVASVPGSDPELTKQAVVFSAHWDHLGIGAPVNGDRIYNGAVDNATGCGILLEIARAWADLRPKPRRSAIFISVTAEEGGLRGSEYFAAHPPIPAARIAADFNFDAFYPFGRTKDVFVSGAERTTLWPLVEQAAARMRLEIRPEAHPEQGHYYRSDHFSFARAGVPAFSIHMGTDFYGKPPGYGEKLFEEYNDKHYHQPSDEYREDWDFSGLEEMAKFGFLTGTMVANDDALPTWRAGDEFLPARQASLRALHP